MRLAIPVSIVLLLMLAGCVSQQTIPPGKTETIQSGNVADIDRDGAPDVWVYGFTSRPLPELGLQVERTLIVYKEANLRYTEFRNLTDFQALLLAESFREFQSKAQRNIAACRKEVGLAGINCPNANTCAQLCSSSSLKCQKLVESYGTAVGESALRYTQRANEAQDALGTAGRALNSIADGERVDRGQLVDGIQISLNDVYAMEANPLIQAEGLRLCAAGTYDASKIQSVLSGLGNHTFETGNYRYTVLLRISPLASAEKTATAGNIAINDRLPVGWVKEDSVFSATSFRTSSDGTALVLSFEPIQRQRQQDRLMMYSFASATGPGQMAGQLRTPAMDAQVLNLGILGPSAFLFDIIARMSDDLPMAFGLALAAPLVSLMIGITLLNVLFNMMQAWRKKEGKNAGLRRALLRTTVRWKTDLILGAIGISVGLAISVFFVSKAIKAADIFAMGQVVFSDPLSFAASAGIFFGVILLYQAMENRIKVQLLEQLYGKEIKDDKEAFLANLQQLRERWKELKNLADQASKEYVDASKEYNVTAELSLERIETMGKGFDDASRENVRDHLRRVEDAIERLQAERQNAEANWRQWKEMIHRLLEENETVHRSQLIGVPGPLQIWALHRFAQEYAAQDVTFHGETITQKKIAPEKAVDSLFGQGIVQALVVTRADRILFTRIQRGSGAVVAALTLKLIGYVKGAARKMGYSGYTSMAAVGSGRVLIISREHGLETLMMVPREKFREAIDQWKEKGKKFSG